MSVSPDSGGAAAAASSGQPTEPRQQNLGIALLVIATAQLMVILDASIVNIALPSIQRALDFSPANLTWVINGYTLAFGGLLLLGGRAGDLFGRRRVFILGILLFSVASLLCGFATNEPFLIAARVLQGAGAAVASPTALALITTTFPEGSARNRAFAVYAAMSGAGAAVGLIAGGLLTDYLNWRWVFFVNVPIGVFIAFMAPRVLNESDAEPGKIDYAGAILGTAGLTILVYGITRTSQHGWSDPLTIGCFVLALLLLAAFVAVEMRHPHPIMPLRLFRNRSRSGTYVVMLIVGAALFAMFYFLSLFVQGVLQYSPVKAGIAFLPFTVGIVVGAGLASQLAQRAAPRVVAGVGLVLATIGLLGFSQLEPDSTYLGGLLPWMLLTAFGLGLTFVPLTLTAVSGVKNEDSGIASALLNTAQQIGGSLGLAILATVATSATNAELEGAEETFQQLGSGVQPDDPSIIPLVVDAVTSGYTQAFLVAAGMVAAAFVITVTVINVRKQDVDVENTVGVG